MDLSIRPPVAIDPSELEIIALTIERGDQIDPAGLRNRLRRAHSVGVVRDHTTIAAVGAIKRPNVRYRDRVFRAAGVADLVEYELGWLYTCPEYRGRKLMRLLMRGLLDGLGKERVYATAHADNPPSLHLLNVNRFRRVGDYRNDAGEALCLLIRPAMPDDA